MIIDALNNVRTETVGGKAWGLLNLQAQGHRVPDFLVLPASVFSTYPPRHAAGNILSEAQRLEVLTRLKAWNWPQVGAAVRSSVADEDGPTHAFPGMMDSFLNVKSEPALWQAVADVVNSAWSERAQAYRREKQIESLVLPAVIIQRQVDARISGVAFTVNPAYPNEMAIHTVAGLGVGLVGGELEPTEIYLDRTSGEVVHRQVRTTTERFAFAPETGIERVESGGDGQLSPTLLAELYRTALRVEQAMNAPQDIEFCVADERLYLLQARPITAPIPLQVVYDNSNIQESYCGVTTPLTFSFAQRAYATVYRQTMRVLGLPEATIAAHRETVDNLLGLVKGRIYYNINNWYRGLQLLPSFRQNKADMERMMGLSEPVDFVEDQSKSLAQKAKMLPRLLATLARLRYRFSRLEQDFSTFQTQFAKQFDAFYALPLSTMTPEELWQQKKRLDNKLLGHWTTPIINDFYVMMKNGAALRTLKRTGEPSPEKALQRHLSGDLKIDSLKPTLELMRLAKLAKQDTTLCAMLGATPAADCHAQVTEQFPLFLAEVQQYIHRYGDRTVGELKLETVTMRVDPGVFYQYLRNYLSTDVAFPSKSSVGAVTNSVAHPKFRKQLAQLKRGIQRREAMRLERTRLFGMYRTLFIQLGERLAETDCLSHPRDIFYLEEGEIEDLVKSRSGFDATLVASRQRQAERWEAEVVPSRVVVPSRPLIHPAPPINQDSLRGEPCVSGHVRGEAIVISRPDDDLAVRDKIICALRTDPGWAALFPVCRAVLIEKGSSLSHSVILLRELGIPTIINIPGLTQAVASGTEIELDGSTGMITLRNPKN